MDPGLEFVFELNAELSAPIDVGPTAAGFRRIIDITGGAFAGPRLRGSLLPGGADWQVIRNDRVTELHAHYILSTDDQVLIPVKVRGLRHAAGDILDRIAAGHSVDASQYYFRVAPVFEAPEGNYEWLNRSVFVGSGERMTRGVRIRIFRLV